ncbi:hypothetical protein SAV14893_053390 [Streptomyces avermitilis]|uniref:Uncharacterized protein n=1 Tax=Streptomyces avermitilis TaxID=33903 RepID=A0A4D4M298_STRAX|nr:hypothetical protein SAV14893_053390 [Streptomyces avermitilis]GDY82918.1 hypothetical protein SAVCW2_21170 [Streptomyces avermitilis]
MHVLAGGPNTPGNRLQTAVVLLQLFQIPRELRNRLRLDHPDCTPDSLTELWQDECREATVRLPWNATRSAVPLRAPPVLPRMVCARLRPARSRGMARTPTESMSQPVILSPR